MTFVRTGDTQIKLARELSFGGKMLNLSLDKTNRRALISAIVASGTDGLNVMFLSFSMSSIMADLAINDA
ncbi:transporter, major facilitator family protein [Streptococcus acidominimus]|uniref:Transporter, major facilitator family protein n=1 Tax=Streptococcus acidominimus TaxID=1326 RepID=A0A239X7A0_STRAI|nr:transporter, major facilitator family protein [Streptococcus acidominimus]